MRNLIALLLAGTCLSAATINVPADYPTIQEGIDAAADGDTVLVAAGEYVITEPITFTGKAIELRGESGAEATVIRMAAEPTDKNRASVVVFDNNEPTASVLEGFTITGGTGTKWGNRSWEKGGGGILCMSSARPAIRNVTITGNRVENLGGGLSCIENAFPTITSCTLAVNSAAVGGGVHCEVKGSPPQFTNCTIAGNWSYAGGGIYCRNSTQNASPSFVSCTITRNSSGQGGGVYCGGTGAFPRLTNCTIAGNSAGISGGGLFSGKTSSPKLVNCIVWGNVGGSVFVERDDFIPVVQKPVITFSCVQAAAVWPGDGNINMDPLFCGFMGSQDLYVDAMSPGGGDGSSGKPFRDLRRALHDEYSLSLQANSPCIAAGRDGQDMGADLGTCTPTELVERVIHLAAGHYSVEGITMAFGVDLTGAGTDETVLEGTIQGLGTGTTLSRLTVTGGDGVIIGFGESPSIEDCTIKDNWIGPSSSGVYCTANASPSLTNCTISGNGSGVDGGGMYCGEYSSPSLTNCTISGNSAVELGGGIYCNEFASPTLTDCLITDNLGGGLYCDENASPTLINCTFAENLSFSAQGGGVYCGEKSLATFTHCTFLDNSARNGGGGVYFSDNASPVLAHCTFMRNSSSRGGAVCCQNASAKFTDCIIVDNDGPQGAGVYCFGDVSPTLTNCTISDNRCSSGGGLYCGVNASPKLTNCAITGNTGTGHGSGVYCQSGSSPTLENCTLSENLAVDGGGGVYCEQNAAPVLVNCIVWGNGGGAFVAQEGGARSNVTYSCIEIGELWPGEGNINEDPLFCGFPGGQRDVYIDASNPVGGDGSQENPFSDLASALGFSLSLKANSPCIASGREGANMGADLGVCDAGASTGLVVHLAPGNYSMEGLVLLHDVSILGSGIDETEIVGTIRGLRTGAILSNLTVTGGTAGGIVFMGNERPVVQDCVISGNASGTSGGGVYCGENAFPVLRNCTITGNMTEYHDGGGVHCCENASPTFENCTITENTAESDNGGGVSCAGALAVFANCTITRNRAGGEGGGVYCTEGGSPTFTDCIIAENTGVFGGGVSAVRNASPKLANCIISENSANSGGGLNCSFDGSATLTGCTIAGNDVFGDGGGVTCVDNASLSLTNCIVLDNSAQQGGGLYLGTFVSVALENCTISGNSALGHLSAPDAGGLYCADTSPVLTNCIVWGNAGSAFAASDADAKPNAIFCCIETSEVWLGEGNINADPLFCGFAAPEDAYVDASSPEGGDGSRERPFSDLASALAYSLSLKANSPCIASGREGSNMGADLDVCDAGASTRRVVHLAPGHYAMERLTLSHGAGILGAGADKTVLEGTVWGLRSGSTLAHVTVTAGTNGGIVIGGGESPGIDGCVIMGNANLYWGSGVYIGWAANPALTNCVIAGNWSDGGIGGVYCYYNAFPTIMNCTITGCSGQGVSFTTGPLPKPTNCIIWNNDSDEVRGELVHCLNDQDPLFVHGGVFDFERFKTVVVNGAERRIPDFIVEAPDFRLQTGSPAIDAGTSDGAPGEDIQGHARPCGDGVDMGAYEMGPCPVENNMFIRGAVNSDDKIDLADAIFTLVFLFANGDPPACIDSADTNDDGKVDLADAISLLSYLYSVDDILPAPFPACGPDPTLDDLDCAVSTCGEI